MIAGAVVGLLIIGWYATLVGQLFPFYPILHFAGLFIILVGRTRIAKAFEKEDESGGRWQPKPYVLLFGILAFVLGYIFSKLYLFWDPELVELISPFSLPLYLAGGIAIVYGLLGSRVREKFALAIALTSYCGIIADHMVGNLMFIQVAELFFDYSAEIVLGFFVEAAPVSVAERLLFTTIATIVGVGLVSSVRRAGLYLKRK